jgi:tripartite-type tricarboxylate transporter receptor subunit TctC
MRNALIMEVNPSVPAKTVAEFIDYAKANPGKLTLASAGNGTPQHLAGELFKMMTGVEMLHVPYRGSAALLTDLLRGEVHVAFDPMLSSIQHIRAGRLRALAVTTPARQEALPDIPTVSEFVPGYEYTGWVGVGVPRGTPVEIIEKLSGEINAGLADSKIKARLAELGGTTLAVSRTEFEELIAEQTGRWAKVIRTANIKPD